MEINLKENIAFIPDNEWSEDFDWNHFAELIFQQTKLYPIDKGDNPIVELKDGVNYHFILVSKEDYEEWYLNN